MSYRPFLYLLLLFLAVYAVPKTDTLSTWVDTIAPVVKVEPRDMYHNGVFHVTITLNEQGTIWYDIVSPSMDKKQRGKLIAYAGPLTIMEEGRTVVRFFGEDIVGNKSKLDSVIYVIDTKPPVLAITPEPGRYRTPVMVHAMADKKCRMSFVLSLLDTSGKPFADSFLVRDSLSGYVAVVDMAGNRTQTKKMTWIVDSQTVNVQIQPQEGLYKQKKDISFTTKPVADVFYTFDPSAVPRNFLKYQGPVPLPYGNTLVRYFAKTGQGMDLDMKRAMFVIDTVPPKIAVTRKTGADFDTILLSTKKQSVIRYTLNETYPVEASPVYKDGVVVQRKGKCSLKAIATDVAGNRSELLEWSYKYDVLPPSITLSVAPGYYRSPFLLRVQTSKPATILYTTNGDSVTEHSLLYKDGITISKEGLTTLSVMAIDEAGNQSPQQLLEYVLDSKPPFVRARVEEDVRQNVFRVSLISDEVAAIYYEIDKPNVTEASPLYKGRVTLQMGQVLRFMAVDSAGNISDVKVMDDLKNPIVAIAPDAGVYNRPIKVGFVSNSLTTIFYRILPDTEFVQFKDSLVIASEGDFVIEYYSENQVGLKSPVRRCEYVLDMTAPRTDVIVKKGNGDSVSIFFECSKNATLYYTLDGSNPAYSQTAKMAGNKFVLSKDRISVQRRDNVKLAFYAEDVAGNQSPIRVLDVFKPRTVPNVPFGPERLYDRILSITFNTFDNKSTVYYAHHGHVPTKDSSIFTQPITLMASDTILAFVVDASGYKGQIDTFVYLIDLPPSPAFTVSPLPVFYGKTATFDASGTIDLESDIVKLVYRWDFNGDGVFESPWKSDPRATWVFHDPGYYHVTLEVMDASKRIGRLKKDILVQGVCPPQMLSMALPQGATFCIDKYEWPNIAGQKPQVFASWVQAKMLCMDAGKRLCTAQEWQVACMGAAKTAYPYGYVYEKDKCATEKGAAVPSGSMARCVSNGGPNDMVGNVWEWTDDKKGDYPVMMGGSFRFGETADCRLRAEGGVGLKNNETGFRCCK